MKPVRRGRGRRRCRGSSQSGTLASRRQIERDEMRWALRGAPAEKGEASWIGGAPRPGRQRGTPLAHDLKVVDDMIPLSAARLEGWAPHWRQERGEDQLQERPSLDALRGRWSRKARTDARFEREREQGCNGRGLPAGGRNRGRAMDSRCRPARSRATGARVRPTAERGQGTWGAGRVVGEKAGSRRSRQRSPPTTDR